jgi:Mini-chromosome maintenance replisome factor
MNPASSWTREYFLRNQEECLQQLNKLTTDELISLNNNLNSNEPGFLVKINHFFVTDIKEPELYCEKYVIKKADGSLKEEFGKFCERVIVSEGEEWIDPENSLGERQSCIITESSSNNKWISECELSSTASNKRKLENETKKQQKYLVKIYDSCEVLLNQLVEVFGFIYPTSTSSPMETDEFGNEIEQPPPYTIHAISIKKQAHNNPLILYCLSSESNAEDLSILHGDIHRFLTQFLFGDQLAAQYMICHLISNVYCRVNDEALGKFTLNLICRAIPQEVLKEYTEILYSIIETLLPNSIYFPVTIENLNTCSLVPQKDYTKNRLLSGILQLPKHTHVIVDETKLDNGKLDNAGCKAVSDLSELIRTQQLSYDFQFYKIPYKTDLPVLILSEGKSLLSVSNSVTY